jgi:hypothetical protein
LWVIPLIVLLCLFAAIVPVFYFALYCNEGTLHVPKRLRLLSLGAALTVGVMGALALPEWLRSVGPYWGAMKMLDWRIGATSILAAAREPRTISFFSTLVGEFSNLAYVVLLIALFRHGSDESYTDVPVSRLLSFVTKLAVITLGLFIVVEVGLIPYAYFQLRREALQLGQAPPGLDNSEATRALFSAVLLFIAPYVVYKSRLGSD